MTDPAGKRRKFAAPAAPTVHVGSVAWFGLYGTCPPPYQADIVRSCVAYERLRANNEHVVENRVRHDVEDVPCNLPRGRSPHVSRIDFLVSSC
jgi:hypothetical protein